MKANQGKGAWTFHSGEIEREQFAHHFLFDSTDQNVVDWTRRKISCCKDYMNVVYGLWEGSRGDDAVVKDLKTNQYVVPERVREINYKGKYFNVLGLRKSQSRNITDWLKCLTDSGIEFHRPWAYRGLNRDNMAIFWVALWFNDY